MLYNYATATKARESDDHRMNLLWLYVPDFTNSGQMTEITSVTVNNSVVWKQNEE